MKVDSRTTIGEVTEEYLYSGFSPAILGSLMENRHVDILIDDISFNIPFQCKEPFREIRYKMNSGKWRFVQYRGAEQHFHDQG